MREVSGSAEPKQIRLTQEISVPVHLRPWRHNQLVQLRLSAGKRGVCVGASSFEFHFENHVATATAVIPDDAFEYV